jgi:hypothetical protein
MEYVVEVGSGTMIRGIHFAGLLDVQNILSADTATSRQTVGHSFGDHLISESVSVTISSVIQAYIVLCSVSLWLVWVNVQSACALNIRYIDTKFHKDGSDTQKFTEGDTQTPNSMQIA